MSCRGGRKRSSRIRAGLFQGTVRVFHSTTLGMPGGLPWGDSCIGVVTGLEVYRNPTCEIPGGVLNRLVRTYAVEFVRNAFRPFRLIEGRRKLN